MPILLKTPLSFRWQLVNNSINSHNQRLQGDQVEGDETPLNLKTKKFNGCKRWTFNLTTFNPLSEKPMCRPFT
jgi:hypothetical protein